MKSNLKRRVAHALSLAPAARTATANGTVVDLAGYEGALVEFTFGVITDGTHTPKLQEGALANGSDQADVAAGDLDGAFTAGTSGAGGSAVQTVGYKGSKRYVRVVQTVAGATTGAVSSAAVARHGKRHQ